MPPTSDQLDTQILDFDSPHSGGGETLPIDYGETQQVDSCDEELGLGCQDWGKTQLIEEFEETEVVRDDYEDGGGRSERTELVADEEGFGDDFVGEVGSGLRPKFVDPDASTDEEEGCGGDGEEVLQSSGFASVSGMTCIPIGKKSESTDLAEGNFNAHNHEKAEDSDTEMKANSMVTMPCSASALNIVGTKNDEILLDHDTDNSFKLYQEKETERRSELNKEKLSSQSPLRFSQIGAVAGLSYVLSQEPGVESQDIALGVVDKFLSVNNEGLSPGNNNENMAKVMSLPIASVKRAQCLVKKTDESTDRKVQVYDWIDSLEDEGGGELFSRRKNSFFDCKGSKQVSRRFTGADNKSSTEGAKSRTCQKLASLTKSKKNLFNKLKEQTNTDTMEQLEKSDVDISDQGVYNCGPATQMAAEAMHALGHSSPVHFELSNLQSRLREVTSTSAKIKKTSRTCSRNASTMKKNKSQGIMACLKLQKNIPKSRTKRCNSSRNQSTKLRTKMILENSTAEITAKMTAKMTTKKSDENCEGVITVNNGKYALSNIRETMKNNVDEKVEYESPVAHRTRRSKAVELLNLNKTLSNDPCKVTSRIDLHAHRTVEAENECFSNASVVPKVNKSGCNVSLTGTINSDYGFSGLPDAVEVKRVHVEEAGASHDRESKRRKMKNIDKENQTSDRKMNNHSKSVEMYTSPVAHRTRRSKAVELLNLNKTLSNDPCKVTSRIDLHAHGTVEAENECFSNASVVPKVNENGCNISLTGTINRDYGFSGLPDAVEVERAHVEEAGASLDKDAYRGSKRRKMKNIDKENQASDIKMNNYSKSVDAIAPAVVKPAIQKKKRKVFIRSFAEILDTVKRRKRSASSSNKSESDGMPSNFGKIENKSGVRTMSSLLSDILKPYFANDSHIKTQLSCKAASDGTANRYSVSSVKQVINNGSLETSIENAQSRLHDEVVIEKTKPEGSPISIHQSGLRCSPTISTIAVSPVCNSQDTSRLSFRKSLSRSPISRELIRLEASYTSPSKLNDVRRRKDMAYFQICFSNHLSQDVIKHQKKILKRLGIQDVSTSLEATHFVADKFVRTRNMLEAMAMGKPVVTPMWLESCGQANSSIDEKNYILRDVMKEKEIGFSMPVSLARACQHPLLQGKRVFITRNARPNQELISSLVKVAGGQRTELSISEENKLPDDLLILSGEKDFAVCAPLLEKGAVIFSSELLLNGIVIQKLEYERHQLFLNQVKRPH